MRKTAALLSALALALAGLALANASDSKTFTVTVGGVESVQIDVPATAPLTVDYHNSGGICSPVDRFCAWYPTVIYSTNYTTNRKLVAKATTNASILSVRLEKQGNPEAPTWGSGGSTPGSWAFTGTFLDLTATDQDVVVGIQNGYYAIGPVLKLLFSSAPAQGTYTATVTFTLMAQ